MKQIKRSFIILGMVSIALIIKAIKESNLIMALIAFLLILLLMGRVLLLKKVLKDGEIEMGFEETDFIHTYLKEKKIYEKMYEIYKEGNCEILYEENDGILLYDHTSKVYLASARTLEGARDIARLLPMDYGTLYAFENIFEQIENIEFPMVKKEKEEILIYKSKVEG